MKKTLLLLSLFLTFVFSAQEQYYSDVDLTAEGITLKENLATKTINAHTNILSYGWGALQATDLNPVNNSEVLLVYGYSESGKTSRTRAVNQNGGGQGDWNREHVYPKALGNPNLGTTGPGADTSQEVVFVKREARVFGNGKDFRYRVQTGGWVPSEQTKESGRFVHFMPFLPFVHLEANWRAWRA